MARTPASDGRDGVGKSGSPAPRSITSSPAALRRFASCEMAIVAEVSRWCRLGERPDPGVMGGRIARTGKGTQPEPSLRCLSLHHALPSLPTDRPLTTEDRVTEADAKAALERGRPVVLVRPPAVEQARDLWELVGPLSPGHGPGVGPRVLVVCADDASAADWVTAAPDDRSIHAVTGLGRTGRVLKERSVDMLAGAPKDLAALLERAALKLDAVTSVVLAWPEALAEGREPVLCTGLPSRDEVAALARLGGGEPVFFIAAIQLPYLRSIATLMPLAVASGADRARDRAEALRERVAALLTTGSVDAELALLDPLFERFDPAEVAAALLALQREAGGGRRDAVVAAPVEGARVKVFVGLGKKDRASAKDLVGALIREAGVPKGDIGRIEVRETFSLVEVTAGAADRAVRGLTGTTIRGRRVLARLDRER